MVRSNASLNKGALGKSNARYRNGVVRLLLTLLYRGACSACQQAKRTDIDGERERERESADLVGSGVRHTDVAFSDHLQLALERIKDRT
jgi:hypothetical protein